ISPDGKLTNLYRSTNAGTSNTPNWAAVANARDPFPGRQGNLHGAILADPNSDHVVYVSGDAIQTFPYTGALYQVDATAGTWAPLSLLKENATTLTAGVGGSTTLDVADAAAIPVSSIIQIDDELMQVTAVDTANNTLTVVRAVNGTSTFGHSADSPVILI